MTSLKRGGGRGFTFTEIMFAVVILGVGFIMIAAIFPVAIRQGQQAVEETRAVAEAQRVFSAMERQATLEMFPPTSQFTVQEPIANMANPHAGAAVPLGEVYMDGSNHYMLPQGTATAAALSPDPGDPGVSAAAVIKQWNALRGDLVSRSDSRFGVAIAYQRLGNVVYEDTNRPAGLRYFVSPASDQINVIAVIAQIRDRAQFNDLEADLSTAVARRQINRDINIQEPERTLNGTLVEPQYQRPELQRLVRGTGTDRRSPATLQFKRLYGQFFYTASSGTTAIPTGTGEPDRIRFTQSTDQRTSGDVSCLAPGTFVIISDASESRAGDSKGPGSAIDAWNCRANGKVMRVGEEVLTASTSATERTFELLPGQDVQALPPVDRPPFLAGATGNPPRCDVLVLGRSLRNPGGQSMASNPSLTSNVYGGPAMDVAVYSTTITLK